MRKTMIAFLGLLLLASPVSAAILTITDGGTGLPYGSTDGFLVDFDSTYAWTPALVAGQQYIINSISIWEASDSATTPNSTPVYLSVFGPSFTGFDGDTAADYLGHSDQAIAHTATPDTSKITYTFTGLTVTADNDGALGGSGKMYFTWDTDTVRNNWQISGGAHPFQRIDSNPAAAGYGAAILAFGAVVQTQRVPEIEVVVTPVIVPEPSTLALFGLSAVASLMARRR
jgi:hypothetical protein